MAFHFSKRGETSAPFVALKVFHEDVLLPDRKSIVYLADSTAQFSLQHVSKVSKVCCIFEYAARVEMSACCHFMLHPSQPELDNYTCEFFHDKHSRAHVENTIAKFVSPKLNTVTTSIRGLKSLPNGSLKHIVVCFDGQRRMERQRRNSRFTKLLESKLKEGGEVVWKCGTH